MRPQDWLTVRPQGLYCVPGDFFIDPHSPVERAVVTHGHADHARSGHTHVLATPQTLAIMEARYGAEMAGATQPSAYGEIVQVGDVSIRLVPAGHVLGSAQVVLEHKGQRIVVSGDYKRRYDPTCPPFEVVTCDVFVTEATFGLPVFRHPPDEHELGKLLTSIARNPDRSHLIGAYALGKCQRVIRRLRELGFDRPIYLHGAQQALCDLYVRLGVDLGELRPATTASKEELAGAVILAPPSALQDRWSRRLSDPVLAVASGWMGVRARARQRGVELPLIISDHADWDELIRTMDEVQAAEIWVTHGREEALVRAADLKGQKARALALIGYDEEET
ncbi:ligase-associated DNA damage response exonuclease [Lacibacterium aquatile]|uniref:Ligase-associated DNA damage response exonuclease n=1 Tax=Lacibacterium aquatile TaxID=1168082 RepID=A0ABW5DT18_9PROT